MINANKINTKKFFNKILPNEQIEVTEITENFLKKVKNHQKALILKEILDSNVNSYILTIDVFTSKIEILWINLDDTPVSFISLKGKEHISIDLAKITKKITRKAKRNLKKYFNQAFNFCYFFPAFNKNKLNVEKSKYFYLRNQDFYDTFRLENKTSSESSVKQQKLSDFLQKKSQKIHFLVSSDKDFSGDKRTIDLNNPRKKLPFGNYSKNNSLNNLTGREWIKFTKSWFIHNPKRRNKTEILHPAKFPESMIRKFITFFTKKGEIVVDPFLGSGSTLIAALQSQRSCIGIEITNKYANISKNRFNVTKKELPVFLNPIDTELEYNIVKGDSRNLKNLVNREYGKKTVDFCITSPPYWNQLKRSSIRQKKRKEEGLDTIYSDKKDDLGNIDEYNEFLVEQLKIFNEVYKIMKTDGYLVIITNNVYFDGRLYPLAYDTAKYLTDKKIQNEHDLNCPWVLKDEKIWLQNDKSLIALGINSSWVGNRHHQFCLIFRKEENV